MSAPRIGKAAQKPETISGRMATFAANLRYEDLPADVQDRARMVLLDTLGCGLAGSATEELLLVRKAMRDAAGGAGNSSLWGTQERVPLPFAALANGTAVHAREMDDFEGCLHSGAVIVPAAFGTAVRVGASGRELLTSIVIGYDIGRRVLEGGGGNHPFKDQGWHSTSLCGGFGAAAAVGRLLDLDAEKMQWALGYAGSNAGGTWAFIPEGAMSKRVHPGFAAQTGVISAYLAANSVTGPASIFETEWGGFYPTYIGAKATPERATAGLGEDFKIRLVGVKPYAACRGIHSSIDSVLEIRREQSLDAGKVTSVTVRGNPTHVKQLGKQNVTTMLDAQFSLPYSLAVALVTGGAMLDQYTPEALRRPEILDLAKRIKVVVDGDVKHGEYPFVDVHLADGSTFTKRIAIARGDRRNPLSEAEIRVKFRANAGQVLSPGEISRLEEAIGGVADVKNVGEIATLLASSETGQIRTSAA